MGPVNTELNLAPAAARVACWPACRAQARTTHHAKLGAFSKKERTKRTTVMVGSCERVPSRRHRAARTLAEHRSDGCFPRPAAARNPRSPFANTRLARRGRRRKPTPNVLLVRHSGRPCTSNADMMTRSPRRCTAALNPGSRRGSSSHSMDGRTAANTAQGRSPRRWPPGPA